MCGLLFRERKYTGGNESDNHIFHLPYMNPVFLVILVVTGNIEGDGGNREDTPYRKYKKRVSFIEANHLMFTTAHTNTSCSLL